MNRAAGDSHPIFTPRQGQYLAFIHAYTLVNGRPPAQAVVACHRDRTTARYAKGHDPEAIFV